MTKKIVFLSGVSGSGKTTVINALLNTGKFKYFPSYVTRDSRPGEINGEKYIFISEEEFKKSIQNNEFLEYAEYCGNLYGTKKDIINTNDGKKIFIKELELEGLSKIINDHKVDNQFLSIFLSVPKNIMIQRIQKRGAPISAEELNKRISRAEKERIIAEKLCNHIITLDDASETENINKVFEILKKEKILN